MILLDHGATSNPLRTRAQNMMEFQHVLDGSDNDDWFMLWEADIGYVESEI